MLQLETNDLFDLVIHTCSFLPTEDNASLYSPNYIEWAQALLAEHPLRTLPQDATLLAQLYRQTPGAYALQFLSFLYEDISIFKMQLLNSFKEQVFFDPLGRELQELPEELSELFRIALYGELQAGYLELRKAQGSLVREGVRLFSEELLPLCQRWPGLGAVRWRLSHPLRAAGRLWPQEGQPLIAVGLPGCFGLDSRQVVLQGCHEYFLAEVGRFAPQQREAMQRASFEDPAFYGAEITALSVGALCWRGTAFEGLFEDFVDGLASPQELASGALVSAAWSACFQRVQRLLL